jgi:hypothetical protein
MANELDKLHAPGQHAKWRSLAETVELRRKCIEQHKWPGCEEDPNFTNDGEVLSSTDVCVVPRGPECIRLALIQNMFWYCLMFLQDNTPSRQSVSGTMTKTVASFRIGGKLQNEH